MILANFMSPPLVVLITNLKAFVAAAVILSSVCVGPTIITCHDLLHEIMNCILKSMNTIRNMPKTVS